MKAKTLALSSTGDIGGDVFDFSFRDECLEDLFSLVAVSLAERCREPRETDSCVTVELEPLEPLEVLVMLEKKDVTEGEVGFFRIGVLRERVERVVFEAMSADITM